MSDFSQAVQTWVSIGDKIDTLNKTLKELKGKRGILETSILDTIQRKKLEETPLRLNNKTIVYHSAHSPAPLSQKILNEVLQESFTDERIIKTINERIKRKRDTMAKTSISLKIKNK